MAEKANGYGIGSLYAIGTELRTFTPEEVEILSNLGKIAMMDIDKFKSVNDT
jgi:GGDEF domain-containing protein